MSVDDWLTFFQQRFDAEFPHRPNSRPTHLYIDTNTCGDIEIAACPFETEIRYPVNVDYRLTFEV